MLKIWNVVADRSRPARWRSSARSSCARASWTRSTRSARRRSACPFVALIAADDRRLDRARRLAPRRRCAPSTGSTRCSRARRCSWCNNLVLVGAGVRRLLGHVLPADLRGDHRRRSTRSARRGSTSTSCRWRSSSCCCRASGRCIAWRRATAANLRRNFTWPGRRCGSPRSSRCWPSAWRAARGAADVRLRRRSCWARVGQEFWPRRARAARDDAARRCRWRSCRSCAATAGATAATSSTSGMALLFVGVAASSAFQHARDVALQAGPDAPTSAATTSATTRPTARIADARRAPGADRARRASSTVSQGRQDGRRAAHRARLLPDRRQLARAAVSRYFEGEATSEVGHEGRRRARRLDARSRRTPTS